MGSFISSLDKILSCIILISVAFYIWSKLLDRKINYSAPKIYLLYFITIVFSILNYYFVNGFIRIIFIGIFLSIIMKFLFRQNLKTTMITTIFYVLIIVVSEGIFALIMNILFDMNSSQIVETQFGNFYANVIIAMLSIIIIQFKFVRKLYNRIIIAIEKLNEIHLVIMSLIIIIIVSILEATLYYDVDYRYLLIFNTMLILFCFCIILYSFKTKNNYIKVYSKYNTTLNSLREYEFILDRYKVSSHENKNQLLTIRNMVPKTNKKVISYIDTIIENKLKDNDKVMFEVSRIPEGGLRGLIYSKVSLMKSLGIEYELEISKEIKTVDLIKKIDDFIMLDICNVIGVYVDNAIQEVEKLKEKYINIEMYLDGSCLIIAISNNYEGIIELDKLENSGYTTKEKGHGYGLTLAKEIVNANKRLSNQRMITRETFAQILKVIM